MQYVLRKVVMALLAMTFLLAGRSWAVEPDANTMGLWHLDTGGRNFVMPTEAFVADAQTIFHLQFDSDMYAVDNSNLMSIGHIFGMPAGRFGTAKEFDGVDDAIGFPARTQLALGATDFTMEAWINPDVVQEQTILSCDFQSTDERSYRLYMTSTGQIAFTYTIDGSTFPTVTGATAITASSWSHIAIQRHGDSLELFVNGALDAEASISGAIHTSYAWLVLGAWAMTDIGNTQWFDGKMDEVRISRVARYGESLTPDSSIYANHGTVIGGVTLVEGYTNNAACFDGSTGMVSIPDHLGQEIAYYSTFTVECRVKPDAIGSIMTIAAKGDEGSNDRAWKMQINADGTVSLITSLDGQTTATLTSSTVLTAATWAHVKMIRNGAALQLWINETLDAESTISGTLHNSAEALTLGVNGGASGGASAWFDGCIDEFHINQKALIPVAATFNIDPKCFAVGNSSVAAIKQDGTLWTWGGGYGSALGQGDYSTHLYNPTQLSSLWPQTIWDGVSMYDEHVAAIRANVFRNDNVLYTWGSNGYGELGLGSTITSITPPSLVPPEGRRFYNACATRQNSYFMATDGLYACGYNGDWGVGIGGTDMTNQISPVFVTNSINYMAEVSGPIWEFMYDSSGAGPMYAWGRNFGTSVEDNYYSSSLYILGQFYGIGTYQGNYTVPTVTLNNPNWKMVTSSFRGNTLALKQDGTLWAWGGGDPDSIGPLLGLGVNTPLVTTPTQIGTDSDWAWAWCHYQGALAIKTDGTLWGWGYNVTANTAGTDYIPTFEPTQIGTETNWRAAWMGGVSSYALKEEANGGYSLWAWGCNTYGQLGLGDTVTRYVPTQVGTDTDWGLPMSRFIGTDTLTTTAPVANAITGNFPTFTWEPMTGATRYELFVYSTDPQQELIHARELTDTTYTATTELPSCQAYWTVRAGTSEGWYEWSQPVAFITSEAPPALTFAAPLDGELNVSDLATDDAPTSNTAVWNGTPGTGLFSDGGYIVPRLNAGVVYPARERSWDGVWSIGFWIKPTSPCYGTTSVFRNNQTLSNDLQAGVSINFLTTQWQFQIFHPGQPTLACLHAGTWTVGTWYWIVANRGEDGVVSFYVNGVLMGSNVGDICNGLSNNYLITLGGYPYFPTTGTQFVTQNAQIWNGRILDPDPTSADATTSVRSYFE